MTQRVLLPHSNEGQQTLRSCPEGSISYLQTPIPLFQPVEENRQVHQNRVPGQAKLLPPPARRGL